jgi:2-keto-4-pentenoate hydratase
MPASVAPAFDPEAARAALRDARRTARAIDPVPDAWVPPDLGAAIALQRSVAADAGAVRGWKVSAVTPAQQRAMGLAAPIAGPLLAPVMHESGARLKRSGFVHPRIECEFAFELAHPLPARDAPWTRDEVAAAVGAMRLGIEIVDSRLRPGSPLNLEIADVLNNGAYVAGPRIPAWRDVRCGEVRIALERIAGSGVRTAVATGDGRAVLDGDPFGAVVLLANLRAFVGDGLPAGTLVTTGSCTGAPDLPGPGRYEADFGVLGRVGVAFDD